MKDMDTWAKLQQTLKDAIHHKGDLHKRTSRSALAVLKPTEAGADSAWNEQAQWATRHKMRRKTIKDVQKASQDNLLAEAQTEQKFLPPALDNEASKALVREAIIEVSAPPTHKTGKALAMLIPWVYRCTTNGQVNQTVHRLPQQNS